MDVRLPNGVVLKNVPEGTDPDKIMTLAIRAGVATAQDFYDPTEGMSGTDKFLAGAGKGVSDLAHGVGQIVGLSDAETIAEKKKTDAKLMESGYAKAGDLTGKLATAAPAMFVPGANTAAGASVVGAALGAAEPVSGDNVMQDKLVNAGLGGVLGLTGHAGGKYLGGKAKQYLSNRASSRASNEAMASASQESLTRGQQMGYKVNPTQANPSIINRALEGTAGKTNVQQGVAMHNQGVTNAAARKTLGMADDAPITPESLAAVRKEAGSAYGVIQGLDEPIKADAKYFKDLKSITEDAMDAANDFAFLGDDAVTDIVEGLAKEEFSPRGALAAIKVVREKASSAYAKGDAGQGRAFKSAASALEDVVERHLKATGNKEMHRAFVEARKQIAKSYSVEKALNPGSGNVVASKLASQLKAGKPLSGELKDAAKFSAQFPRATQEITSSMPGFSPLDVYGSAGLAGGLGEPGLLGAAAVRPGIRSLLTSDAYQKAFTSPSYGPGMSEHLLKYAPHLLGGASRMSPLLGLSAPSIGSGQ